MVLAITLSLLGSGCIWVLLFNISEPIYDSIWCGAVGGGDLKVVSVYEQLGT